MVLGGLEIFIAKWIGGYITTAVAGHLAHAAPAAVAHFAHAAATNVIVSASSTSTATGVILTLYAGGKAGAKLTKKVMKMQSKAKPKDMFKDEKLTDEERAELLIAAVVFQLAEGYFASLKRPKSYFRGEQYKDGRHLKKRLLEMERCEEENCDCMDYVPNSKRDYTRICQ